jgi:hypothetical protein
MGYLLIYRYIQYISFLNLPHTYLVLSNVHRKSWGANPTPLLGFHSFDVIVAIAGFDLGQVLIPPPRSMRKKTDVRSQNNEKNMKMK